MAWNDKYDVRKKRRTDKRARPAPRKYARIKQPKFNYGRKSPRRSALFLGLPFFLGAVLLGVALLNFGRSGADGGFAAADDTVLVDAQFHRCSARARDNCIIDGDTIRYRGEKIRIADIDTPEVSKPGCAREKEMGDRATDRMQALLNEGDFTLTRPAGTPNRDRYERLLRVAQRGGVSVGDTLVAEGLAEVWGGERIYWCR
ncbi:thermonuclease family protein [Altererythrobacter aquiaggeris]|uniref:thermonuclease family protein n=1 Tax=Aestuarierythrobacter aquiaggeris TaxID=1898396 RepID=UPI0030177981